MYSYCRCTFLLLIVIMSERRSVLAEDQEETCTHNFVVPNTDLVSICENYSKQQLQELKAQVRTLKAKVANLTGETHNPTDTLNQQFSCTCNNTTSFEFSFRGKSSHILIMLKCHMFSIL